VAYFKPAEVLACVAIAQACSPFGLLALPCEGRAVDAGSAGRAPEATIK